MIVFLYAACAVFGLTVIAAAVIHFRARADRFKNAANADDRTRTRPIPYGTRAAMEKILEGRLDE